MTPGQCGLAGGELLASMLLDHPLGKTPATHALFALMCLNAVSLPARIDSSGDLHSLFDQDRSQWDRQLVRHWANSSFAAENVKMRSGTLAPRLRSRAIPWSGDFSADELPCASEMRHCSPDK